MAQPSRAAHCEADLREAASKSSGIAAVIAAVAWAVIETM